MLRYIFVILQIGSVETSYLMMKLCRNTRFQLVKNHLQLQTVHTTNLTVILNGFGTVIPPVLGVFTGVVGILRDFLSSHSVGDSQRDTSEFQFSVMSLGVFERTSDRSALDFGLYVAEWKISPTSSPIRTDLLEGGWGVTVSFSDGTVDSLPNLESSTDYVWNVNYKSNNSVMS